METYTREQIKKAFWDTFHKTGEQWFNYLGDDAENEETTNGYWYDFEENLANTKINQD